MLDFLFPIGLWPNPPSIFDRYQAKHQIPANSTEITLEYIPNPRKLLEPFYKRCRMWAEETWQSLKLHNIVGSLFHQPTLNMIVEFTKRIFVLYTSSFQTVVQEPYVICKVNCKGSQTL